MALGANPGPRRPQALRIPWRGADPRGEPLAIRAAVQGDAASLIAHMGRIVSETPFMLQCAIDPLPTLSEQRQLLEQIARTPNSTCIVAVRPDRPAERRIVGSCTCLGGRTRRTRHAVTLGMGVDRSDWRLGVGAALLDAALTWARANPMLTRMGLQVFTENAPARALYVSRGFAEEGPLVGEVLLDDAYATLMGMGLDVDGHR